MATRCMSLLLNAIGPVALVAGLSSYALKSHRPMLFVSSAATLLWALFFFLKGANTAAALVLLSSVRIALGAFTVHWDQVARGLITGFLVLLVALLSYLTWDGATSLPATLATLFLTVATLNLKYRALRWALLLGELLWFWNAVAVGSMLGGSAAMLGFIFNAVVMLKDSSFSTKLQFSRAPSALA